MNNRSSILYLALGLSILLAALHYIAIFFYFYWTLWWFDNMMHYLAGLCGGLIAIWFFFRTGYVFVHVSTLREVVWISVLTVLLVGVAWEFFEYIFGIAGAEGRAYVLDTFSDLVFDTLGAITAGYISTKDFFKHSHD